jgi:hypothetical protein
MSKGDITQNHGNGLYTVTVNVQRGYIQNKIERTNAKIIHVDAQKTIAEAEYSQLDLTAYTVRNNNNVDIAALMTSIDGLENTKGLYIRDLTLLNSQLSALRKVIPPDEVAIAAKEADILAKKVQIKGIENQIKDKQTEIDLKEKEIEDADNAVTEKRLQIDLMEAEYESLKKTYNFLVQHSQDIVNYSKQVWCCDLSTELSGTVPLLTINTDSDVGQIIPPASLHNHEGLPSYSPHTHGEIIPFIGLGVADALRNFLAKPALQKWAPTYRYGTVIGSGSGEDTLNVALGFDISDVGPNLTINQTSNLYNVPVEYMYCNAGPFEAGDEVVVEFENHDWNFPKVIGFKSAPKDCGWTEPWDGPLLTSKYPWEYSYSAPGATILPDPAVVTVSGGVMTMTFGPTPYDSGAYSQEHLINYDQWRDVPIAKNIQKIKFSASAMILCYGADVLIHNYYFVAIGPSVSDPGKLVNATLIVVDNKLWPHIGCIGYDFDETDWESRSGGPTPIWWHDNDPYNWIVYEKLIKNDRDVFFKIPEKMSEVWGVEIGMNVSWGGGAAYQQPHVIPGGTMSVDICALA